MGPMMSVPHISKGHENDSWVQWFWRTVYVICVLLTFFTLFGKFHQISNHHWPVVSLPFCPFVKFWPRLAGSTHATMHFDQRSFSFYTEEAPEQYPIIRSVVQESRGFIEVELWSSSTDPNFSFMSSGRIPYFRQLINGQSSPLLLGGSRHSRLSEPNPGLARLVTIK